MSMVVFLVCGVEAHTFKNTADVNSKIYVEAYWKVGSLERQDVCEYELVIHGLYEFSLYLS